MTRSPRKGKARPAAARTRRARVVLAVAACGAVLAAAVVAGAATGSGSSSTTTTSIYPSAADELLAFVAGSRTRTFQATYQGSSKDQDLPNGALTLQLWRQPPQVREDSSDVINGETARTTTIRDTSGKVTSCSQAAGQAWQCRVLSSAEAGAFDDLEARVRDSLATSEVTARDVTERNLRLRCFQLISRNGSSTELCFDGEGLLYRIVGGDGTGLIRTGLSRQVPSGTFTPPGKVT